MIVQMHFGWWNWTQAFFKENSLLMHRPETVNLEKMADATTIQITIWLKPVGVRTANVK